MVTVRQLFFNTPARRKFLKTVNTEMGHVADTLAGIAMGWPQVTRAALWSGGGPPTLVLESEKADHEDCTIRAASLGIERIRIVPALPLDRRHRSKIDYTALDRMMRGG